MYKKRKMRTYSPRTYTFNLSDFSRGINKEVDENLLNMNYAKVAYNVKTDDKALKKGYGIKEFSMPNTLFDKQNYFKVPNGVQALGLWSCRVADTEGKIEDLILMYGSNKKIYCAIAYGPADIFLDTDVTLNAKPSILTYVYNGFETVVMTSPEDLLYTWNGSNPTASEKALHLSSICCHYERLFASSSDEKNRIRFSEDFNILNWEETSQAGGFIELVDERGQVNKVLSFNDYVYILRDYGISRLSAYGDQSQFAITHLNLSSNKIYSNTACLCGDRIILLTQDGLKFIVGSTLYDFDFKINNLINKEKINYANACYYNNKYYLAINLNFEDNEKIGCENEVDYKNNALIEFDIDSQRLNIMRGVDISHICAVKVNEINKLIFCFNGQNASTIGELCDSGNLFEEKLPKCWITPTSDLGINKKKVVRNLKILTNQPLTITLFSEKETQTLKVCPSKYVQTLQTNLIGYRIGLKIFTNESELDISNLTVELDVLD